MLFFQLGFGFCQEFAVICCNSGFFRVLALLRIGAERVQRLRNILRDRLGLAGSILCGTHQLFVGGKLCTAILDRPLIVVRR